MFQCLSTEYLAHQTNLETGHIVKLSLYISPQISSQKPEMREILFGSDYTRVYIAAQYHQITYYACKRSMPLS